MSKNCAKLIRIAQCCYNLVKNLKHGTTMATTINVSVDDALKKETTEFYSDLGLTLQEAIRIFLRRSVKMKGLPFPMQQLSDMEIADAEIQQYKQTGKGLVSFDSPKETFNALNNT